MRLASKKSKLSNEQNLIMENEFLRTIIKVLKEKIKVLKEKIKEITAEKNGMVTAREFKNNKLETQEN